MKLIIILSLIILSSCAKKSQVPIIASDNLESFRKDCGRLARCMEAIKVKVVYFPQEKYDTHACSIEIKPVQYEGDSYTMQKYFYPSAIYLFDKFEYSGLRGEIDICELLEHKGDSSPKIIKETNEYFINKIVERKKFEAQRKEKEDDLPEVITIDR